MDSMKRFLFVPAVGVMVLGLASTADAQFGGRYEPRQVGYDNGYNEGLKEGQKDGRARDAFEFRDERAWRNGDKGYHRNYGDRERYRQIFRNGFEAGYNDGYRRYAPYGNGRYGRGRAVPRGNPAPYPSYPNRGPGSGYPGGYGYPGNDRYGYNPAHSAGLRDGYEKGREDARDRDRYEPQRHSWYRSGDRDYRREYGSRDQYRDLYRQAFREGYDRGYRESGYGYRR